jgi:hypothetical protein
MTTARWILAAVLLVLHQRPDWALAMVHNVTYGLALLWMWMPK